ncbi:MAG: acetyl-CoA C-acyltransferase [Actinobacteria bacterium]|jgi:acetyl-CoA acetyltransferase family protein|nr:acetyl-CoA C-acyltransferase [Actinomycetota bacterium]NBR67481.1 acetyl-CoA C-acyltransferase [Actinomycetota bacterium]NBU15668.1 acetyl-CoA C-acyltransferase [Actinomycetota bacterium]
MQNAVIVDAIRTPLGKRNGRLKEWHPVDLAAQTLKALVERNNFDPALIDDVIMGCVMQVGEQSLNIGRNAVLAAGLPETIPGTTIDRQCGSSQQAAHFAAQGVMAGAYDIVIASGVEVMTRVPMGAAMAEGKYGFPFGPQVSARYAPEGGLVPQGISAELIADKWDISRDDMDAFGVRSQELAARATKEGRFEREILPVVDAEGKMMTTDEGIRDTTRESLGALKPAFRPVEEGGRVTAGNSSQITDGASAVLIMSEEKAKQLGLTPRARFVNFALAGDNPRYMLTAPIPSTRKVLERAGLTMADISVTEINEAFASVVLAWEKELRPDMSTVNPNGGAIALGHPLGASGTRLLTTLLHELERTDGRYGLQTMCEGGGMANATIIERLG